MRKAILLGIIAVAGATSAFAQVFPTPGGETPRVQTVQWASGQFIVLTALPASTLTVMLEPGEVVRQATLNGSRAWDVSVSSELDSFQVTPEIGAAPANLIIETDNRRYEFILETGLGLMAAYLVRLQYASSALEEDVAANEAIENLTWSYRLRGDREVRPTSVRDNGDKTVIEYAPGQSLPAVFAIGPTGDEEVVDGYMRDEVYVIDRVHQELVFRIDRDKATARRNRREDGEQ